MAIFIGYDLVKKDYNPKSFEPVYSFEPMSDSKYKWFIHNGKMEKNHYKNMTEICNELLKTKL